MTHALPLRRIVVGVDGSAASAASAAAVRWAVREARLRHATVHLVCAYHGDARLHAPYVSSSWTARLHLRCATARVVLDLATEAVSRRLPPERLISELAGEPPARALLDRAADAEMLVLGTTRPERQPGQPTLAMGPVARTCLRMAHCPVVVVAPDEPSAGQGAGRRRGTLGTQRRATFGPAPRMPRPLEQGRAPAARFPGPFPADRPAARPTVALSRRVPCARSPSRLPTSITPPASQISFGATGISSRSSGTCGAPVSTTTPLRTIAVTPAGSTGSRSSDSLLTSGAGAGTRSAGHGGCRCPAACRSQAAG